MSNEIKRKKLNSDMLTISTFCLFRENKREWIETALVAQQFKLRNKFLCTDMYIFYAYAHDSTIGISYIDPVCLPVRPKR